jgi:signal transduction histidine kinase
LRDGRVSRITAQQGLPDNALSRLIDDGRGRIWISTNRGLAMAERDDLAAVANGDKPVFHPVLLGSERGVAEANFGSPAGFADENGRLWFGTIDGVVSIDAARFPFNPNPPVVRLESVSVDDRPLPLGPTVAIPAGAGRVQLAFTTNALLYPERIRFRFRVEGVDPDWVDIGTRRFAIWAPAGPGRRRFMVEARNEDGVWSAAPAAVELDVLPAWWQRSAVRFVGLIAIAAAVAGAFRLRLRAVERRHAERVRGLEERRRADERAAELRAQLEHVSRVALAGELATSLAHEVNQPLTAIVSNAQAARRFLPRYLSQPAELEDVLTDIAAQGLRASEVIQGLRGFLRGGAAEPARIDLSALVREMLPLVRRELEENLVQLELALADGLAPAEGIRVQLGQIVVNLVVNACEALAQVDGPRRLSITTRANEAWVELAVRDSGPGISPEIEARLFQPFVTTKPGGMGMGLAICRSIAESHGGRLSVEAPPDGGVIMILALPAVTATEVTP